MHKQHIKDTLKLSLPLIVGQLGQMFMGVVDSMMVGQIGTADLAAVAIGHGLFMVVQIFGFGLALGLVPVVSERFGAGETTRCGIVLRQSLLAITVSSIFMTVFAYYATLLIPYLGQDKAVEILAINYAEILAFSTIPMLVFATYKSFTEALNITAPAMIITLVANLVNAFVNWVLIYGNLGFNAMGIEGAGWATFSSRVFMMLALMLYVLNAKRLKPFDPTFHFKTLDFGIMKRVLKIGSASGLQYVFEGGAFVTASFIIGILGKDELAAHQIAMNLASMTYMIALGMSMATSIRVSNAAGRQNKADMRMAGFVAMRVVTVFMATNALLFILFRDSLPYLYTSDPNVIGIASELLIFAAIFQIADGIQAVGIGALRGLSDITLPTRLTFIAYWLICLPVGVFLGFTLDFSVQGVWAGLSLGLIVSAVLLTQRFNILTR
jgi:MATE family multidrug resistance protein